MGGSELASNLGKYDSKNCDVFAMGWTWVRRVRREVSFQGC